MIRPFSLAAPLIGALALTAVSLSAQVLPPGMDLSQILASQTGGAPAVLQYNNRTITTLRASVLSRSPHDRADAIVRLLDRLIDAGPPGTVTTREIQGIHVIAVGGRDAFGIVPQDVDTDGGETPAAKTADAVRNLQLALDEAVEMRSTSSFVRSAERSTVATVLFVVLVFVAIRVHRRLAAILPTRAEEHLQRKSAGTATSLVVASRATHALRLIVTMRPAAKPID